MFTAYRPIDQVDSGVVNPIWKKKEEEHVVQPLKSASEAIKVESQQREAEDTRKILQEEVERQLANNKHYQAFKLKEQMKAERKERKPSLEEHLVALDKLLVALQEEIPDAAHEMRANLVKLLQK